MTDNEDPLLRLVARQARRLNLKHDAILARDMERMVEHWNRGAEELYRWTAEQLPWM